jgi:hypothetical protein
MRNRRKLLPNFTYKRLIMAINEVIKVTENQLDLKVRMDSLFALPVKLFALPVKLNKDTTGLLYKF